MTTLEESSFEQDRILEEESRQPERAGRGFCTPLAEGKGRLNKCNEKVVESRKRRQSGALPILGPRWRRMRWSRFRMKGVCGGERGECEGERRGDWLQIRPGWAETHLSSEPRTGFSKHFVDEIMGFFRSWTPTQ